MPVLCIDLFLQGDLELGEGEKKIELSSKASEKYIELLPETEYTLVVGTRRKNYLKTIKAHCPQFHRAKDEGWFLVLGDIQRRELWAMKRVSGINGPRKTHYLQFNTPANSGKSSVHFVTDSSTQ